MKNEVSLLETDSFWLRRPFFPKRSNVQSLKSQGQANTQPKSEFTADYLSTNEFQFSTKTSTPGDTERSQMLVSGSRSPQTQTKSLTSSLSMAEPRHFKNKHRFLVQQVSTLAV